MPVLVINSLQLRCWKNLLPVLLLLKLKFFKVLYDSRVCGIKSLIVLNTSKHNCKSWSVFRSIWGEWKRVLDV